MIVDLPQLQELSLPPTMIGRPGIEEIANILSMELLADLLISFLNLYFMKPQLPHAHI
jgi:hypothetical protein